MVHKKRYVVNNSKNRVTNFADMKERTKNENKYNQVKNTNEKNSPPAKKLFQENFRRKIKSTNISNLQNKSNSKNKNWGKLANILTNLIDENKLIDEPELVAFVNNEKKNQELEQFKNIKIEEYFDEQIKFDEMKHAKDTHKNQSMENMVSTDEIETEIIHQDFDVRIASTLESIPQTETEVEPISFPIFDGKNLNELVHLRAEFRPSTLNLFDHADIEQFLLDSSDKSCDEEEGKMFDVNDKIVATKTLKSNDDDRIKIQTDIVMVVKQCDSENILVDSNSWKHMHWIGNQDRQYLQKIQNNSDAVILKKKILEWNAIILAEQKKYDNVKMIKRSTGIPQLINQSLVQKMMDIEDHIFYILESINKISNKKFCFEILNQFVIDFAFDSHNVLAAIEMENSYEKELQTLETILDLFALKIHSGVYVSDFAKKKKKKRKKTKLKNKRKYMPVYEQKTKARVNQNDIIQTLDQLRGILRHANHYLKY